MAGTRTKRKANDSDDGDEYGKTKRTKPTEITESGSLGLLRRSERVRRRVFRFMDLPQELKDMMFHELWLQTPTILFKLDSVQDQDDMEVQLHYGGSVKNVTGLPEWLFTNKAILEKGLKILHANSTLCWREPLSYNHRGSTFQSKAPLLTGLSTITKARIQCTFHGLIRQQLLTTSSATRRHVGELVPRLGTNMKVLSLTMTHSSHDSTNPNTTAPWNISLPSFDMKDSRIEELNVRLETKHWGATVDHLPRIQLAFASEVARLVLHLSVMISRLTSTSNPLGVMASCRGS